MKLKTFVRAAVLVILGALCLSIVVSGFFLARRHFAVARLEDRIDYFKREFTPLRFMVLSRSDQAVSARFRLYDADGREIASFERSWNGSELAIDSVIVPVSGRILVFPSRVFTDATAPRRGTDLFAYYDRDGFPAVFDSVSLDDPARKALSVLFSQVKDYDRAESGDGTISPQSLKGSYGGVVHDLKRLREFEVGSVYALIVRVTGGMELIRE